MNNTTTMNAPASLSTRAMLSDLTVSLWSGHKHDKQVSDEVATSHGATLDAGRYNKRLVAKEALAELQTISRRAFDAYYTSTLPWADSGLRIFPSALYFKFMTQMSGLEREFDQTADKFASAYPQVIADARRSLNGLFKDSDYPAAGAIRSRFAFKITMMPLPDSTDFRVTLGDEAVSQLQADWQRDRDLMMQNALTDVVSRIRDVVGRMSDRLHAYKVVDDKVYGIFRDTLVSNVRELADILPALNITDDARVTDLIDRVRASLCQHDADVLRDNPTARLETAEAADAILSHVNAFFA